MYLSDYIFDFYRKLDGLDQQENVSSVNLQLETIQLCLGDLIHFFKPPEEGLGHETYQNGLKTLKKRQSLFQEEVHRVNIVHNITFTPNVVMLVILHQRERFVLLFGISMCCLVFSLIICVVSVEMLLCCTCIFCFPLCFAISCCVIWVVCSNVFLCCVELCVILFVRVSVLASRAW